MTMKRPEPDSQTPTHDYGLALQSAVSWLGERYLLATPQARREPDRPKYWTAQRHAAAHASRSTRH
jgi:hypothetical protein